MAAGLVGLYCVLRWGFGFDWLEAQRLTRQWYWHVVTAVPGRLTVGFWVYVILGNLLAFALYLGLPVVAGAVTSVSAIFREGIWAAGMDAQFTRAFWDLVTAENQRGSRVRA